MANDKDKIEVVKRIKEEIARLDKASAKAYQDTLKSLDATVANLDAYQKLLDNIKNDVAISSVRLLLTNDYAHQEL